MLLDPSPDMVHGSALRKTHSSTQEKQLIPKRSILRRGINPCYSGFQVQGAADSPAGMACLHGRKKGFTALIIAYFRLNCKALSRNSEKIHKLSGAESGAGGEAPGKIT